MLCKHTLFRCPIDAYVPALAVKFREHVKLMHEDRYNWASLRKSLASEIKTYLKYVGKGQYLLDQHWHPTPLGAPPQVSTAGSSATNVKAAEARAASQATVATASKAGVRNVSAVVNTLIAPACFGTWLTGLSLHSVVSPNGE